ncbi:MAG: DUF1330 domain-containing protein [Chloroflexota bacterium]
MAFETVIGLHVTDDDLYQKYRDGMTPILHDHGGDFGYDFKIAEVLRASTDNQINRVFTIHFPNKATMEKFFANEAYLQVRQEFFEPAVESVTRIAAYEK